MNKEYRKRLFDILDQIDELAEPMASVDMEKQKEEKARDTGESEKKKTGGKEMNVFPGTEYAENSVGPNRDTRKRYSTDFKKMIVKLHAEDRVPVKDITEQYGVSKATITLWCSDARYNNFAKAQEEERKMQDMQKDYEKVKEENIFLKKVIIMMFGNGLEVHQ